MGETARDDVWSVRKEFHAEINIQFVSLIAQYAKHTTAASQATRGYTTANCKAVHEAYTAYAYLSCPQDHSESHEFAIAIMNLEIEEKIELNINDVQCYVRDCLKWRDAFRGSVSAHTDAHSHRI